MAIPREGELWYWEALRSADSKRGRAAAHVLASILRQRGERRSAERMLRDSLKAHGPDGAAATWFRLGRLLEEESRIQEAEAAFAQAGNLASVDEDPEVVIEIAARVATRGLLERSVEIYELVASECSLSRLRALAFYRLGLIQVKLDCIEAARWSFDRSLSEADSNLEPFVLVRFAELLIQLGETIEAADLLQRAVAGNHHDQAPRAALALARLRAEEGDALEAYRLYQLAAESAHAEVVSVAAEEKKDLVETGLDFLLLPNQEPTRRRQVTRPLKRFSDEIAMRREKSSVVFLALCHMARDIETSNPELRAVPAESFERHSSSLYIPSHSRKVDCAPTWRRHFDLGEALVLDAESHRAVHNLERAPELSPARSRDTRHLMRGCLDWLLYIGRRGSGRRQDEEDLLALLQLLHQKWSSDQSPHAPEPHNRLWAAPLLTAVTQQRISAQAGTAVKREEHLDDHLSCCWGQSSKSKSFGGFCSNQSSSSSGASSRNSGVSSSTSS
jgi:tetratricopeptide (TPR) repeat protein